MKNVKTLAYFFVAAGLIGFMSSCASANNKYVSANFQQLKQNHKTIAILPFDVRFPNQQNGNSQSNNGYARTKQQQGNAVVPHKVWTKSEQEGSLDMQQDLFVSLAKEVQKGHYAVSFQDFTKTNKILQENNILLNDIAEQDKGKLAQMLGVDAVIWGETNVRITPMNNLRFRNPYAYYNRAYNDGVETTANIYDATTGEMLWSMKDVERPNPSFPSRPSDLANRLMQVIAKDLPYKVAKR